MTLMSIPFSHCHCPHNLTCTTCTSSSFIQHSTMTLFEFLESNKCIINSVCIPLMESNVQMQVLIIIPHFGFISRLHNHVRSPMSQNTLPTLALEVCGISMHASNINLTLRLVTCKGCERGVDWGKSTIQCLHLYFTLLYQCHPKVDCFCFTFQLFLAQFGQLNWPTNEWIKAKEGRRRYSHIHIMWL